MAVEHTVSGRAIVPAPQQAVWDLVSNPDRFADWADRTVEVTRADKPLRIGSTYEETNTVLGPFRSRTRWMVVELEEPRRTTHRGEGVPIAAAMDFFIELRPAGERATDLLVGLRYRPALGPIGTAINSLLLRRRLQRSFQRTADNIAAIAEHELAPETAPALG